MGAGHEHPGHGIQLRRLLLGDAEQLVVKQPLVPVANQALIGAGHALRAAETADGLRPPAIAIGYGLLNDLPFAQQVPEVVVAPNAARHPVAVTHYGDAGHWRNCQEKIRGKALFNRPFLARGPGP